MNRPRVPAAGIQWAALAGAIGLAATATALERDPLPPRVPIGKLADAKKTTNPIAATPEANARGTALFEGKGTWVKCHGLSGSGNGSFGKNLKPSPRNLTNAEWQKSRTDGELFWVIKYGSPATGMVSLIPSDIDVNEAWHIVRYLRTLEGP